MNNNNINLQHSDSINHDEDSKDISVESEAHSNKQEKDETNSLCRCGDPSSHKDECSLFCGHAPCHDKLLKLPKCSHCIHEKCLEQLLFTRLSKCPLCRASIDTWRRSRHYQKIEEEIASQFQTDTERAIRLSQKLYEEQHRKNRDSRSNDESERGTRSRSRSRERNSRDETDYREHRDRNEHNRNNRRYSR